MSSPLKDHIGHDVTVYTVERHGWTGVVYDYIHPQTREEEAIVSCGEDDFIEDLGKPEVWCLDCDVEVAVRKGEIEW